MSFGTMSPAERETANFAAKMFSGFSSCGLVSGQNASWTGLSFGAKPIVAAVKTQRSPQARTSEKPAPV